MKNNIFGKIFLTLLLFISLIASITLVSASTYKEYTAKTTAYLGLNIRSSASSNATILGSMSLGTIFKYTDSDVYINRNDSCNEWIYVSSKNGYVCKTYTEIINTEEINDSSNEMSQMTDEEFNAYLDSQGFDSTYKVKLKALHKRYPSWVFKGVKTSRDWQTTVNEEMALGYNTYYMDAIRESAGHEAYLYTDSYYDWYTNMFYGYDGSFFLANKQTVAYFMDPRNYLNESNIFMFESLYYDATYQNKDNITSILGNDKYNDYIYTSGKEYNYSPTALAIKIRQEGTIGRRATNGTTNVNCTSKYIYKANGTFYKAPLYNFFNIGAYSSPTNADLNGLCYAAQTNDNYFLPWNTPEKSIKGGTKWISEQYVKVGQYTNYFQKFNTASNTTDIAHQYMTNLEDPKSQASTLRNLYADSDMLRTPFVFYIPIFTNMPEQTTLPKTGNPNNWLASLSVTIDNTTNSVSNFDGSKTQYQITVPSNANTVTINSTSVAKTSYISVDGNNKTLKTNSKQVNLTTGENSFKIIVTAGNGDTKTYTLNITRQANTSTTQPTVDDMIKQIKLTQNDKYLSGITIGTDSNTFVNTLLRANEFANIQISNKNNEGKPQGVLSTGDKIYITSNSETKHFELIVYGDVNGDGTIDKLDYLAVLRHYYKYTEYTGVYEKAADANKDGVIDKLDYLAILRDYYGYAKIIQ